MTFAVGPEGEECSYSEMAIVGSVDSPELVKISPTVAANAAA